MTRYYLLVIILLVLAILIFLNSGKRIEAQFREWLLKKWQGHSRKKRYWLGQPSVVLVHGDREVTVVAQKISSGWQIQVMLDWQSTRDQELELVAGQVSARDAGLLAIALPGLGLPKCMASDERLAADMMGASGKTELAQLLVSFPTKRIRLNVEPLSWKLEGEVAAEDFEILRNWILQALRLHDQMRVQTQMEVEFVSDKHVGGESSICGVCGQAIESDLVRCRRCRAAHHRECWEFNGKCSTYGCQESLWIA
jgi:Prokaryotic RING finger family 1